jgi:hypothetical protein
MLDLFFPINGVVDVPITLVPNQPMASVISRETRTLGFSMFLRASPHAVRHSNIKNVRSACDDVDVVMMFPHY